MSSPYIYRAYGLRISSDIELPELEPEKPGPADVTIRLNLSDALRPVNRNSSFEFEPFEQRLSWSLVGSFIVRNAREIEINPAPDVAEPLLRLPLLGPVMAVLLHYRRFLVLHASAIAMGERGVIFVGDKLAGKSTTAAALVAEGHRLLADDVVAVDFSPIGPLVIPAFPHLKLEPITADILADVSEVANEAPHISITKKGTRLTAPFSHTPVPPSRIYILGRGASTGVFPLNTKDAFEALLRFSYIIRFRRAALGPSAAALHMEQCAALAGHSRISHLVLPRELSRLEDAGRLIESDIASQR